MAAASFKNKRKQRLCWDKASEGILLQLWEDKMPQLRVNRRNSHIHAEIATALVERGFILSGAEVKVKIHNMKNKYRDEKKKVGASGGSPSTWTWFNKVHNILDVCKSFKMDAITEESSVAIQVPNTEEYLGLDMTAELSPNFHSSVDLCIENQDSSSCEPAKKKKINSFQQELVEEFKESNKAFKSVMDAIEKIDKEAVTIQKELLEVEKQRNNIFEEFLKTYTNKNKK